MDIFTGLLATFIFLFAVYFVVFRKKRNNPPPGPKGYPLIGSTFDVDAANLHLTLTKWACKYGDIFEANLFGSSVIVLNSSHLIREALLKEPNATVFANRVEGFLTTEIYHNLQDIAFGSYSEHWVKRRKLGHRILKAYGEGMKAIEHFIHEELKLTVATLESMDGILFDPENIINGFLNQIVSILLTGRRHDIGSKFMKGVELYDRDINRILSPDVNFLIDWLPFMRYIPCKASRVYHATKQSQKNFEELVRQESREKNSRGIIHELYEEMKKMDKSEDKHWLTEYSVFAILTNMVAGGILTSKGTLWSALRILIERKDIQKRLQEEVDHVVGVGRQPSLSDRINMPYTEAFIIEVLRHVTILPLGLPHRVSADTELSGYDIQKDSMGTLWSALRILIERKDIQKRLQEEVDHAVGVGRQPSLSDRINMPYTEAFIIEVLRHVTILPLGLPHRVSADTELSGYDIQKDSMILLNLWKVHHDSSIFLDPEEFNPERFLDTDGCLLQADSPRRQSFLAFGVGKRSCIGEVFARSRVFLFISTMMQCFTFEPDVENGTFERFDPRDMQPTIVRMPKIFRCKALIRET